MTKFDNVSFNKIAINRPSTFVPVQQEIQGINQGYMSPYTDLNGKKQIPGTSDHIYVSNDYSSNNNSNLNQINQIYRTVQNNQPFHNAQNTKGDRNESFEGSGTNFYNRANVTLSDLDQSKDYA